MTSKIKKQKQISALLNTKFSQELENQNLLDVETKSDQSPQLLDQARLIYQLYHFYKSIIQNINSGLLTIDLTGEITFANKSAADLLGCPVQQLLGKDIRNFFEKPEDAAQFLDLSRKTGKNINEREFRFLDNKGRQIIVDVNASRLQDENNNFEGIVLLFRDLTEVRHLRNQVERMERLALLGELSAGIAHEIRNPLAGIKASVQVLEETFGSDDIRNQLVARIVREVDKANRLLKEFFKFAKPTRPKFGFYNIEMLVDSVFLLLAPRLKKRNINFEEDIAKNLPDVYVDETQIEQVILNLFLNAIDAMEMGGNLRVRATKKRMQFLDDEPEKLAVSDEDPFFVVLEISDTGPGISPENLRKIFNPFYTTKPEGLGLGLSICSRLVEENRGKIDVVSQPGNGSTFILALPGFIHQ